MNRIFLLSSLLFVACGSSSGPDTTPPKNPSKVDVAIAAVTLAEDCGHGPTMPPAPDDPPAAPQASQDRASSTVAAGASMSMAKRACEQSSIQLRVANATTTAAKVAVQRVELFDSSGTKVGELTPRDPSRWSADDYQYASWDELIPANGTLQVSYALSAPSVSRGATYTVKVVVTAGDGGERTLEQTTTLEAEASLPPGVVT
jgi:hypothetical protein